MESHRAQTRREALFLVLVIPVSGGNYGGVGGAAAPPIRYDSEIYLKSRIFWPGKWKKEGPLIRKSFVFRYEILVFRYVTEDERKDVFLSFY